MRAYLIAIGVTILSWSAFALDGTNLRGQDYADFSALSIRAQNHLWRRGPLPSLYMGETGYSGAAWALLAQAYFAEHCQRSVL